MATEQKPGEAHGMTVFYNRHEGWVYTLQFNGSLNAQATQVNAYSEGLIARYQALALECNDVYVFECNRMSP